MLLHLYTLAIFPLISGDELWTQPRDFCPLTCTCQLEHLTETAIYRFMQKTAKNTSDTASAEYNDVLYEDNLELDLLGDKQIVRSAICILQNDHQPEHLLVQLPENIESLTLIQGHATGNKTLKFSSLTRFKNLLSLELVGSTSLLAPNNGTFTCEIDMAQPDLKLLNLEGVQIKNSVTQLQKFVQEFQPRDQTFEYAQKVEGLVHTLTMVQQGTDEEILPYEEYKKQNNDQKLPLFVGFKNLFFLRISHCALNTVHWAMFDGLNNLQYLMLDKNNIRFIPPFTFYGTPNLHTLSLAHNSLLNIQITDLAGLLELQYLDLSSNNFSQLSELSLAPFPKLKLADFGNNPITTIFPNTFEVMNTTSSLVIGGNNVKLSLMPNCFSGLNLLKTLTLINLDVLVLKRDYLLGMPSLQELSLTGNISKIEYDAFIAVLQLKTLMLNNCNLRDISMDAFIGLELLEVLDLSWNNLETLPPAVFDQLINIKELYLNNNAFTSLPYAIFSKIHVRLLRLNNNPWHCSCDMSIWKPVIVNRIKQKVLKPCEFSQDKGLGCQDNRIGYKYIYDSKVAPKCSRPKQYFNWSVFHVMRRLLKCPDYKPKIRKHGKKSLKEKMEILREKLLKMPQDSAKTYVNNTASYEVNVLPQPHQQVRKIRKYKKSFDNNLMSNSIF